MKKIIKLLFIILIFWINHVFAATVDHFDITLWTEETSVNKAVDLTIEAKDKNWNTVKDYVWTILLLSETDPKAELPKDIKDNAYTFSSSDQWKVKFENALIFKTVWKQEINVFDLSDENILWVWEINVTGETSTDNISISIISPEDWIIIWTNYINVSWKTQKNHKVIIKINWTNVKTTTSDDNGNFEEKIENLEHWNSTISADILNSDDEVVWTSNEVKITINSDNPEFNSIKITPSLKVEPETIIWIEVNATAWLKEVSVIINDEIIKLTESGDWVYKWQTSAPKDEWEYNVNVKLINELGNQTTKIPATKLTIIPLNLDAWTDEIVVDILPDITETWATDTTVQPIRKKIYKIANLELTKLKDRSILRWSPISEAESYNIYKQLEWNKLVLVDNVKEPRYEVMIVWKEVKYEDFVVEPVVRDENWELIKWEISDVTKIQTWPELIILLILSLFIWFLFSNKILKNKNW